MIPGLPHALLAVFNSLRRTAADTRHAVDAVATPDGPAILDGDVVGRAESGTFSAAGTGVAGRKRHRFDKGRIEDRIHRAAHETVVEVIARRRECLTGRDGGGRTVNVWLRFSDNLPRLLHLGCVEHGDVILRHSNLRRTHIGELFVQAECTVIFGGVANLTAAGHDKPRPFGSGKFHPAQPVFHQTWDAPGIGGRDDYQIFACLDRQSIPRLDTVVHAEELVAQDFGGALCDIPAVASTAEIEYHACTSLPDGKGRNGLCCPSNLFLAGRGSVAILRAVAAKLGVAAAFQDDFGGIGGEVCPVLFVGLPVQNAVLRTVN